MDAEEPISSPAYVMWQVSPERQRYEWMQFRRSIVSTRIRLVVFGHLAFFAVCVLLKYVAGIAQCEFFSFGWWSLFILSSGLLMLEWLHVKTLPRVPPRFMLRQSGLTEYGEDGPRMHLPWQRTFQLSIETSREQPQYRSLVFTTECTPVEPEQSANFDGWVVWPRWQALRNFMHRFSCLRVPLPEHIDELQIAAAIDRALEESGIDWKAQAGGAISLLHSK